MKIGTTMAKEGLSHDPSPQCPHSLLIRSLRLKRNMQVFGWMGHYHTFKKNGLRLSTLLVPFERSGDSLVSYISSAQIAAGQ